MSAKRGGGAGQGGGRVSVLRRFWTTELRFVAGTGQSRMWRFFPDRLLVDYTRTMLAALLHVPAPREIGIVGLGGGSQPKFLHRHLREARLEVFETEAEVIALRGHFRIPPDDARLCVVHGDAAALLPQRVGRYDLLLVDGYDARGIPPSLSTQRFYNDCRASLAPGGVLACNLFDTDHAGHLARLRLAFGAAEVVVLEEPRQSNRVAFGFVPRPADAGPRPLPALDAAGRRQLAREFGRLAAVRPVE